LKILKEKLAKGHGPIYSVPTLLFYESSNEKIRMK
jgi:hypothetical protein